MKDKQTIQEPDRLTLPDRFFESLAEVIARKVYQDGKGRVGEFGYHRVDDSMQKDGGTVVGATSRFVYTEIKKMYEYIPSSMMTVTWEQIEKSLNENFLLDKLYDINDRINSTISGMRGSLYINIYRLPMVYDKKILKMEDEATYIDSQGKERADEYTAKIDQSLRLILANLENAFANDLPAEKIEIGNSYYKGRRVDDNKSLTDNLRFLIDISRGNNQGFDEVFRFENVRARDKLKIAEDKPVNLEPYEKKILTQFSRALVQAHINLVKEKTKHLPELQLDTDYKIKEPIPASSGTIKFKADEKTYGEIISEKAEEVFSASVGWVASMFGYESERKAEDRKTTSSTQADEPGMKNFIYNHATKILTVMGGVILASSALYTGGLNLLPLIGFASEVTAATILLEGSLGATIGAAFGKTASYMSAPNDSAKSTALNKQQETHHHRDALTKQANDRSAGLQKS